MDSVIIDGETYRIRCVDNGFPHPEDRGLYRAHKVTLDQFGRWVCCDDDDYMIDPVSCRIVAKEIGWELRREKNENAG